MSVIGHIKNKKIMDKEKLKIIYINLRKELGRMPSMKEFLKKADISAWNLITKIYRTYGDLVNECGDTPNKFGSEKTDPDKIFFEYGTLVRKINGKPAISHWINEKVSPSINSVKDLCKWSELPLKFIEFAACPSAEIAQQRKNNMFN